MMLSASVDALLDDAPKASVPLDLSTAPLLLGLALGSWVLGEALMAPVLRPFMLLSWLGYIACFFVFTAWYFRISRLADAPWRSYKQALPPMIWSTAPLHVMFPAALLFVHAGLPGMLAYEIVKAGVILAVLTRLMHVFQELNQWPRWAALILALSPLAMAFACAIVFVCLGGLMVVALGLSALLH